jgi:TolA-binding protein
VLSVFALTMAALTASALERKAAFDPRQVQEPAKALPPETSPMPVQWQLDQLRARVQELEGRVAALQGQAQQGAGANLAGRLAILESAVQVESDRLRLHSPGAVEIHTGGIITLDAGAKVRMAAGSVELNSALLRVHGTAQSVQVVTDAVVSKSYTPAPGNVW